MNLWEVPGTKFGMLTAVRRVDNNKYGQPMFLCNCDCGRSAIISKSSLVRPYKNTRSCGCLIGRGHKPKKIEKMKFGELASAFRESGQDQKVYLRASSIRHKAVDRNVVWTLDSKLLIKLVQKPCTYCGDSPPELCGLDRIDSSEGYTNENVTPCCRHCNSAKMALTLDDFKAHITKIARHLKL